RGFGVSDADSAGETLTVFLFDTGGTGSLAAKTSATGGGGTISGSGTSALQITGTLTQVNADLLTLTDTQAVNSASTDVISMFATDSRSGGSQFVETQLLINQPPQPTVPPSAAVSQNVSTAIAGI